MEKFRKHIKVDSLNYLEIQKAFIGYFNNYNPNHDVEEAPVEDLILYELFRRKFNVQLVQGKTLTLSLYEYKTLNLFIFKLELPIPLFN